MANEINAIKFENATEFENWCTTKNETIEYSLKWTVENFSCCNKKVGQFLSSNEFTSEKDTGRRMWRLILYPNGQKEAFPDFVTINLELASGPNVGAKFNVEVSNSAGKTLINLTSSEEMSDFDDKCRSWGWPKFVDRKRLLKHLLSDDKLVLLCKITAFGAQKVSSGTKTIEEFRIPERQYASLSEDLGQLFDAQTFTDCVLIAEDKEISVHKTLLVSRSPVFRAMFEHDTEERRTNRIVIKDVEFDVLKETLRFMYTNEASILPKMADKLLAVANKYALTDLKTLCEKSLANGLTLEKAFDVLALADLHDADRLKRRVTEFLTQRAEDFVKFQLETTSYASAVFGCQ